jgi:hypothetical protein
MRTLFAALFVVGLCGVCAAEEVRPLRLEVVDEVIEKADRAVQRCSRLGGGDSRAVLLRLEIGADGKVLDVIQPEQRSAESQCLARVARTLSFPATGTTSHVAYPFVLTPRRR